MSKQEIRQELSEFLQQLLLPNGVRLHPRHRDDGGRSGSFVGGDEDLSA